MKFDQVIYRLSPLFAFFFGIWYFCFRILGANFEYIPGDFGDSRFISYLLEHGHQWLMGDVSNFWHGEFMYPFPDTIAFSESMIGTMPIYSLFRNLNFSPESAYQFWWLTICALNYWLSYWVFKKWLKRSDIACVLAWIFAFSVFNLSQINYTQMTIRFVIPISFYAAYAMLTKPAIRYLFIYCFSLLFQFYCVSYTGFYLLYFSLLFIFVYCVLKQKGNNLIYYIKTGKLKYSLLIISLSMLAVLLYLWPYQQMSKIVGLRLYKNVVVNLPVWQSFLFAPEASTIWGFLFEHMKPRGSEWWIQSVFIGIIPLLCFVASPFILIFNRLKPFAKDPVLISLVLTATIIALLHLRTETGLSFYAFIFKLPGINSMRVLNRFMHVELFILLLIFGYFIRFIKLKFFPILVLLVFADNLFTPNLLVREKKAEWLHRKEAIYEQLSNFDLNKYNAVALIDTSKSAYLTHLDMMLAAQQSKVKTVNGYSSYCPDNYGTFFLKCSEEGLLIWMDSNKIEKKDILIINHNRIK